MKTIDHGEHAQHHRSALVGCSLEANVFLCRALQGSQPDVVFLLVYRGIARLTPQPGNTTDL